jgi:hypothetical protein
MEEVLTIDPAPASSIGRSSCLMLSQTPLRLTPTMRSQSASSSSVTAVLVDTPPIVSAPALLKAMSRRP